ncbi:hypothetical protein [Bosea sp. AS-1]|uniref:hypothetical protein n=1 Tax=Bosea sp. AS-1 TaxID=2015316 RepID=UPI000B78C90E|nr:hypothetical protein [Bosea sp. AS-1]
MASATWRKVAREAIDKAHAGLDRDIAMKDRKAAIDAVYPFGPRMYHPYKIWLSERKAYLARWSDEPAGPLLSPLDRAKAAYEAARPRPAKENEGHG